MDRKATDTYRPDWSGDISAVLDRQRCDEPCAELQDQRGIERVGDAIFVDIGSRRAGDGGDEIGAELEDERRIDGGGRAAPIDIADGAARRRRVGHCRR